MVATSVAPATVRSAVIPQAHHGLCVADIDAARAALAAVGFTKVQPGAAHPLVHVDEPGDDIGQRTCAHLGSPYRTQYVEHPVTRHQIDLVEIDPVAIVERPCPDPLSGDLTVVMPLPDVDHAAAEATLAPHFGHRVRITSGGRPGAVVHIAAPAWLAVRAFLADVVDVGLRPHAEGRWLMDGVGGDVEVAVSSATRLAPTDIGKRYPGANHLRLLHRDLAAVDRRLDGTTARWLLPPHRGSALVVGPGGLTIEMIDGAVTA